MLSCLHSTNLSMNFTLLMRRLRGFAVKLCFLNPVTITLLLLLLLMVGLHADDAAAAAACRSC